LIYFLFLIDLNLPNFTGLIFVSSFDPNHGNDL